MGFCRFSVRSCYDELSDGIRSPDEDISEAVVAIPAAWFREVQLDDLLRMLLAAYSTGRQKLSQVTKHLEKVILVTLGVLTVPGRCVS